MSLKVQFVRNHRLDDGLVVHVDKEQDVTLAAGVQDTVIEVRVRKQEPLK